MPPDIAASSAEINKAPLLGSIDWALDAPIACPGAKLILVLLARAGAQDGAKPSVAYLAQKAGMDRRSVARHLTWLKDGGWLSREDKKYHRTKFTLAVPSYPQVCG